MTECNVFEDEVERIRSSLYNSIASVTDMDSLNAIRVATLGRKGSISSLLKDLKNLDSQQVSARGAILNQLKVDISGKISARKDFIRNQLIFEQISSQSVDVSLPVFSSPCHRGRIHQIGRASVK